MVKAARDDYRLNGYCIHLKQGKGLNRVNTTAEVKKNSQPQTRDIVLRHRPLCVCYTFEKVLEGI